MIHLTYLRILIGSIYEDAMASSEDPDQTAPMSSLIWGCTVCLDMFVQKLRFIALDQMTKSNYLWISACPRGNLSQFISSPPEN